MEILANTTKLVSVVEGFLISFSSKLYYIDIILHWLNGNENEQNARIAKKLSRHLHTFYYNIV